MFTWTVATDLQRARDLLVDAATRKPGSAPGRQPNPIASLNHVLAWLDETLQVVTRIKRTPVRERASNVGCLEAALHRQWLAKASILDAIDAIREQACQTQHGGTIEPKK